MCGHGTFKFGTGEIYVGEMKNNKMNGHGVLYLDRIGGKVVYCGRWRDNTPLNFVDD